MAWVEQTGKQSWRVRYTRPTGGHGSVSGFKSRKAAQDYAEDLESDRRPGRWLDPDGAKTSLGSWAERWVPTLDVETRTEENYLAYLRNHILPRWGTIPLGGDHRAGGHRLAQGSPQPPRRVHRQMYRHSVLDAARRCRRRAPHPDQPGAPPPAAWAAP
jgi:hypothetical protein